jgi:hypothetical protein
MVSKAERVIDGGIQIGQRTSEKGHPTTLHTLSTVLSGTRGFRGSLESGKVKLCLYIPN